MEKRSRSQEVRMAYSKDSHSTVDNIIYDEAILSSEGEAIEIEELWMPRAQSWSPVYTTLTEPFSFDNFTSPRMPIDLGPFDIGQVKDLPRILRMTIKEPGSTESRLPKEVLDLKNFLVQVLTYERTINERFEECEIHITLDHSVVEKNTTQRFPGWHVDGLQGGKFKKKLMAEHSYVIATNNPTEFCLQPFFIKHYQEDITNFFKVFDQQARESNVYLGLPNHLYLMDAYMVHRTPEILEKTERGFIRITVANAPLPIEFNTLNPMFNQERAPYKLDIRDWLRAPDIGVNYDYYGLDSKIEQTEDRLSQEDVVSKRSKAKQDIGVFDNRKLTVGEILTPENRGFPKVQPLSPTYRDMVEDFDPMKYTNPRLPIDMGQAPVEKIQSCPNVLRMPLKWWDSLEVAIPKEFLPLKSFLERIFSYDRCHNPLYESQVAHITHDSRVVEPGLTHRFPGFHGDDLQGGAFPHKETAAHSYIVTTSPGTEFCLQPFFVAHIDDTHEKHFTEFDKQALEENVYRAKAGNVYLMDPYAVHRTPLETHAGLRTFLRITFSTPNMLLPHNTENPMFSSRQNEYDSLPMDHLNETWWTQSSNKDLPYEYYGLQKKS